MSTKTTREPENNRPLNITMQCSDCNQMSMHVRKIEMVYECSLCGAKSLVFISITKVGFGK